MEDVMLDRCVKFIDEVEEVIQETRGQTRYQALASVYKALPPRMREREVALAILRERKASRTTTSAWRKEPVTFVGADAGDCRRVLDGVDPVLPQQLAAAPAVNSLTLRVSWPPWHCAATGFIASSHEGLLALCLGTYPPGSLSYRYPRPPGCYLVLNTRAHSVAVVPPLPDVWVRAFNDHKHWPIGSAGVAVIRTDVHDEGYLLVELYRHTRPTNTGTLFMWCSRGSGSGGGGPRAADQWIRKEVVLPLPVPDEDDDAYYFNFNPGTVFAVSSTSLCWVDVRAGMLVCDNLSNSSSTEDDELVFTFIPLPDGCAPGSAASKTEYRSVCCVDSETIRLVCMDDGGGEVTVAFAAWTLKFPLTGSWRWEKDEDASCSSLCVADLLDDAIPVSKDDGGEGRHKLLRRGRALASHWQGTAWCRARLRS